MNNVWILLSVWAQCSTLNAQCYWTYPMRYVVRNRQCYLADFGANVAEVFGLASLRLCETKLNCHSDLAGPFISPLAIILFTYEFQGISFWCEFPSRCTDPRAHTHTVCHTHSHISIHFCHDMIVCLIFFLFLYRINCKMKMCVGNINHSIDWNAVVRTHSSPLL